MTSTHSNRRRLIVGAGIAIALAAAPAAAAMTHATPDEAPAPVAGALIEDSYIVVLEDSDVAKAEVRSTAKGLVQKYGGEVRHSYTNAVRGFSASMSPGQAKQLEADPSVAYVEQNRVMTASDTQSPVPSWGLDRIDQVELPLDDSYTYESTGSGVTAYIVDTGILNTHEDFGGRAVSGTDTVDGDDDATDCAGHGTHVAGTVGGSAYGVAKDVSLVGVRVLDCGGSGSFDGVIAGIDWVTADHQAGEPAVANMSLGGGFSQAVNDAVSTAVADGVTFALAAGNDSGADACDGSPSSTPEAITVGATEDSDARAAYSNIGTCVDIFAPGTGITSAWYTGDMDTNTISGTSMATPHVAGAAALVLSGNPAATPAEVGASLSGAALPDVVTDPGTGSPNLLLNVSGL
ncbi:Peptidase inhibitor I9 [Promicromonospora umidemergens]|uniref:Subtilisin family serine protease n=1 Tax=Promicromonospora umidemergens TaxID=629679 RepID=A0ABP8YCS0_9MICO|nr:S8 family peptidase [Promicromonospora umidemergens]MCP2282279.1 Peptidase inhibitor I9 [Promicromonospora umidemergens]